MKKLLFLIFVLTGACIESSGQGLKLTAFGGYTVQDKIHGYYGDLIIKDSPHYGAMLSYEKSNQLSIDLSYQRQQTTYGVSDYTLGSSNSGNYSGSVSYIMIGATHSPDFTAKVSPFGGGMLGAAIFTPEKYSEEWKFAVGGKLGVIVHASDKIGIVLQTQLMIPVQGVGVGVGCGGGGCGSGVTTSSTATQLGFSGGLEIKLNK